MKFFDLILDSDYEIGCNINDYDLNGFDLVKFWELGNISDNSLFKLRLDICELGEDDFMGGPLSLPIVSERFKKSISELRHNAFFTDIKPAIRSGRTSESWYLLEFNNSLDAREAGYTDLDFFRSTESTAGNIIISEKALSYFNEKGLKGIAYIERVGF